MTTRKIDRLSAIATPYQDRRMVVLPKAWQNKRIYCLLQDQWDKTRQELKHAKVRVEEVTAG